MDKDKSFDNNDYSESLSLRGDMTTSLIWNTKGAYPKYSEEYDVWYYYYGLDCSGFAAWAYVNAGYEIKRGQYPSFWGYSKYALNQANGDVGDFILNNGHVKLIVGKTDTGYICAEASGKSAGMCLSTHPYSNSSGYWIAKGDKIAELYPKYNINNIPTGI